MKKLITLSFLLSFSSFAQGIGKINLLAICQDKPDLIIIDNGFCEEYLNQQEDIVQGVVTPDKWKIRFYASHSFTTYFDTDITFQSTRYNIEIKDYSWAERGSRAYFTPQEWAKPESNPFQMIDEPTNTFTLSFEKDGNEFFFQAFHPKFLQAKDQVKYIIGTIDGVEMNGYNPVNKPFDGWDQTPGECEIMGNQNTKHQMTFEIGYGHRFNLVTGKLGSINYIPSVSVGVMTGSNVSLVTQEGWWWDYEGNVEPYRVQGVGGSITNRVEFNTPKERFGVFYENKLSYYHQEHGFLDGTQVYNLGYTGNSIGFKFMIYNPKNH